MKQLLLTGVLMISGLAFGAQNEDLNKTEETSKTTESCAYCIKSGEDKYCASADTCKEAKELAQEIKELSEN